MAFGKVKGTMHGHGSTKGAHGKFHKGGALKAHGHQGTMRMGKSKGKGDLLTTPANVGHLGHKAG